MLSPGRVERLKKSSIISPVSAMASSYGTLARCSVVRAGYIAQVKIQVAATPAFDEIVMSNLEDSIGLTLQIRFYVNLDAVTLK